MALNFFKQTLRALCIREGRHGLILYAPYVEREALKIWMGAFYVSVF